MIVYRVEQGSYEWWRLRLGIPTSSKFHKILTPKKRQASSQAPDYLFTLLGERLTGEPSDLLQTYPMQRGQALEDQAILAYEGLTDQETKAGGFVTNDAGTIGCSPDRFVGDDGLLEIKCPLAATQVRVALLGDGADEHVAQIQGQLWITGRQWCDVFHFHPALVLPPHRVLRDEDFIRDLSAVVTAFAEQLARKWIELEQKYGPFIRLGTEAPPPPSDPDGVSDADLDAIFAARRQKQEQRNG
jgi:hypothetical protein